MKERSQERTSIRLIVKFSRESSVPRRRVNSHQRRERRRGPETDQRHDWKRTLSIHFGNCETSPTVVIPALNFLTRVVLFVLQMLLLFRRFGDPRNKAFPAKRHWLYAYTVKSFSRHSSVALVRRILLGTFYHGIVKELLKKESNYISYTMSWNNMEIYNIN